MVSWEILESIGAYVAGELSGEEARRIERFVLEDAQGRQVAKSYTRLLALLSVLGREPMGGEFPVPPQVIVDHAVRGAADGFRVCGSREVGPGEGHNRKAGQEDARKEGR